MRRLALSAVFAAAAAVLFACGTASSPREFAGEPKPASSGGSTGPLPSTSEAHRLVQLASEQGHHANVAAAIFRVYFERGADIGDVSVLAEIGIEAGLPEATVQKFRDTRAGDTALLGSEERLRGFGVRTVPNLLFGGRVLVPGTVNVATYVHALDQALFPVSEEEPQAQPTLQ